MKQTPSKRNALYKYLLIAPVAGFLLVMFSFTQSNFSPEIEMESKFSTAVDTLKPPPPPVIPTPPVAPSAPGPSENMVAPSAPTPSAPPAVESGSTIPPPPPPTVKQFEMEEAFVVIDGKESTTEELKRIDPSSIEKVEVVKGEEAVAKHGVKAKDGAIYLTTKKNHQKPAKYMVSKQNGEEEVFKVVEDMPRFPGCEDMEDIHAKNKCASNKLVQFISENLKYPKEAREAGVEGMAILSFVVNKEGAIEGIEIIKDPGYSLGEAAVSAMREMGKQNIKWIPGKQRGKLVKVQFTLPVKFRLPKKVE